MTRGWRRSTAIPSSIPGAGSHATYLERGEYIMLLPFPGERYIRGPLDLIRRTWRDTLAQPDPGDLSAKAKRALSVPFVDYARGDGRVVGPGGDVEWTPIIVGDEDGWVDRYRGLWGLDTGDRFAGERAPAGPKYTRTGTVRQSWRDPLGFAGLGKVAPPSRAIPVLEARIKELTAERAAVVAEADALAVSLPKLDAELAAVRSTAGLDDYRAALALELQTGEARLTALSVQDVELGTAIAAGRERLADLRAGHLDDPRLHLRHASEPEPPTVARGRAHREAWAAVSVGLLVAALAVVVWFRILPPPPGHRRPVRVVPRDRGVLQPRRHGAGAQDHGAPRDPVDDHPGRDLPPRAAPGRPARPRAPAHLRQPRRGPAPPHALTGRAPPIDRRVCCNHVPRRRIEPPAIDTIRVPPRAPAPR